MGPRKRGRVAYTASSFSSLLWYSFLFQVLPERYEGQPKLEEYCWITDIFIWPFILDSILHFLEAVVIKAFKSIFLCSLKLITNSHIIVFFKKKYKQNEIIFCIYNCCFLADRFLFSLSLSSTLFLHAVVCPFPYSCLFSPLFSLVLLSVFLSFLTFFLCNSHVCLTLKKGKYFAQFMEKQILSAKFSLNI